MRAHGWCELVARIPMSSCKHEFKQASAALLVKKMFQYFLCLLYLEAGPKF